jgi:hypothetical protein
VKRGAISEFLFSIVEWLESGNRIYAVWVLDSAHSCPPRIRQGRHSRVAPYCSLLFFSIQIHRYFPKLNQRCLQIVDYLLRDYVRRRQII